MHDGSIPTLRDVVKRYNDGGVKNPWLSVRIKPLHLSEQDVDALVAFLESLAGEGYQDTPPKSFPQ
jgi:cytochrome c peroxidase